MDFYDAVTQENAKAWYDALPPHLKKQVDAELDQQVKSDPHEIRKLDQDFSKLTTDQIGYDLPTYVAINHTVEGNSLEECQRFEKRKAWSERYNELVLVATVSKIAPRMQKDRKMLSQALGLKSGGNGLPSQAEGLDTTQAATVRWLESSGETPLEYLTSVYRDDTPDVKVSDKIAAARALLDYVHRKVPAQIEVKGPSTEDLATQAAIVRDVGDQLVKLASMTKKLEK